MDTIQNLKTEQGRVRQEMDTLLATLKLQNKLSTDFIINLVYEAGARWGDKAHLNFQKDIYKKVGELKNPDDEFAVVQLAFECWNYFPHKDMDNKSPFERLQENPPEPKSSEPEEPKIIVGDKKMSPKQYEEMIREMEKQQALFKDWLNNTLLAYKQYLEKNYKQKTIDKHYTIADILCDRILHVGFVSPEHVRPEFLYDKFPAWWQTHVMFGDFNETTVENSVAQFMDFIEKTTSMAMDDEYVKSNPAIWSA